MCFGSRSVHLGLTALASNRNYVRIEANHLVHPGNEQEDPAFVKKTLAKFNSLTALCATQVFNSFPDDHRVLLKTHLATQCRTSKQALLAKTKQPTAEDVHAADTAAVAVDGEMIGGVFLKKAAKTGDALCQWFGSLCLVGSQRYNEARATGAYMYIIPELKGLPFAFVSELKCMASRIVHVEENPTVCFEPQWHKDDGFKLMIVARSGMDEVQQISLLSLFAYVMWVCVVVHFPTHTKTCHCVNHNQLCTIAGGSALLVSWRPR